MNTKTISKEWKLKKIADLLNYERPDKYIVKSTIYSDKNETPVLTANKSFILGYTDENFGIYENVPVIIFDDFTTDCKFVDFPFKIKSSAIKILKAKNKDVNLRFAFEKMKSISFPVGNHKRYYISQYQDLEVATPPINEQTKIAEILSSVDEDIEKVDQEIKKIEEFKKGLIQELFTKSVKFKKIKIKEISEVTSSKRVMVSDYVNEGIPFYRSTEIIKKSKNLPIINSLHISLEKFNFFKDRFGAPEKGDLLVTAVGTIGDVYMVQDEIFYFKDGNSIWIRKIKDSILPEYLRVILGSNFYREKLNNIAGGSSQKALTIQKLGNVEIPISSTTEQKKITEILSAVDNKIDISKQIKNKLAKLKKGLMQDLLSGRVRTK